MRLSFRTHSIQVTTYWSRRELDTALQSFGGQQEIIDVADGEGSAFYPLKFVADLENSRLGNRHIVLCACRTGIKPQVLLSNASKLAYLGLDTSLLVSTASATLTKRIDLGSPFYWITLFDELEKILVAHEIGLLCLDNRGDIIWKYDAGDIVSSVALFPPRTISLSLLEAGNLALDLTTGRTLERTVI